MDKQAYITPAMEVVNVETVEMMAASLGLNDSTVDTSDPNAQLSGGRRGSWGDLWGQGE